MELDPGGGAPIAPGQERPSAVGAAAHLPREASHVLGAASHVLRRAGRVLCTMHQAPDGDALGTSLGLALALRDAGKHVVVLCAEPVPRALAFLPGADGVVTELSADACFDATVASDAGHPARLPEALPSAERRGVLINLDHHRTTPPFGDLNLIDPDAAAAAVMAFRVLCVGGFHIGAQAASALYVALLADTGSFRYGSTNPEALRMAAALVEAGARPGALASAIWERNTVPMLKLLEQALATLELALGGRLALMTLTREAISAAGTIEETADGLVTFPRSIEGVAVAALLREQGRLWRVSLRSNGQPRSRGGFVDVARIAQSFGGGGHAAAAGFTLVGTREDVRRRVLDAVHGALET